MFCFVLALSVLKARSMAWTKILTLLYFICEFLCNWLFSFYRVVGTEERIPIPLMDYILNVVRFIVEEIKDIRFSE